MTDREKDLERRLAKMQELFLRSMLAETESTARLMLAQAELLGVDLENEEPNLFKSLKELQGDEYECTLQE